MGLEQRPTFLVAPASTELALKLPIFQYICSVLPWLSTVHFQVLKAFFFLIRSFSHTESTSTWNSHISGCVWRCAMHTENLKSHFPDSRCPHVFFYKRSASRTSLLMRHHAASPLCSHFASLFSFALQTNKRRWSFRSFWFSLWNTALYIGISGAPKRQNSNYHHQPRLLQSSTMSFPLCYIFLWRESGMSEFWTALEGSEIQIFWVLTAFFKPPHLFLPTNVVKKLCSWGREGLWRGKQH